MSAVLLIGTIKHVLDVRDRTILVELGNTILMIIDFDIAFCAGFFDADGGVSIRNTSACLTFYNDIKEVLEKIREVLSVDNNILPREKPAGGTSYVFNICKKPDVIRITDLFLRCSLVTVKREALESITKHYAQVEENKRIKLIEKREAQMIRKEQEQERENIRKKLYKKRAEKKEREKERIRSFIEEHPELSTRVIGKRLDTLM